MDQAYLLKRRAETIARHQVLESVSGSGYHPDDQQAIDMMKKKQLPLSKRPVAIQHDGKVWLCGDDVPLIRERLKVFVIAHKKEQDEHIATAESIGIEPSPPTPAVKQAYAVSKRVSEGIGEVIELPSNEFNAILLGLRHRSSDTESITDIVVVGLLP